MKSEMTAAFDFSQDAHEFRERLAGLLQQAAVNRVIPLDDDDLAFVNAAGSLLPPPEEDDLF